MASAPLLVVRGLGVRYAGAAGPVFTDLDLDLAAGECLAVVGPSGCGKSTLCRALLDLLPSGASLAGRLAWEGRDLTGDRAAWHRLRGAGLGLLLQDHRFALDPVRRVGDQVAEVVRRHRPALARPQVRDAMHQLLAEVRLPAPDRLARRYPHQLSGGQRQRACLAAALAAGPRLLLADEPTTALDLLVQRDIVKLLRDLVDRRGLALLLVTHDRDLVPLIADRTLAWPRRAFDLAPDAPTAPAVTTAPAPRAGAGAACLRARGLSAAVPAPGGLRAVVHGVDLTLGAGRTLGLVGESGAGKTTLARVLAGWHPPAAGGLEVERAGERLGGRDRVRAVQMVSQDATAALDPRQTPLAAVVEAARAAGDPPSAASARARDLLREVDLDPACARRLPGALSGGQRQRVQIARALAARPCVLIADEPASSLDLRRRTRVFELLRRLQQQHALALLLISHDLAWLEAWCDEIAVMLDGRLVEVYRPGHGGAPLHPFARALAGAACVNLRRETLAAVTPAATGGDAAAAATAGCPYAPRCRLAQDDCHHALPALRARAQDHLLRCPPADHHAT